MNVKIYIVIEVLFFPSDHNISSTTENACCHKASYQVKPPLYQDNSTSMNHQ